MPSIVQTSAGGSTVSCGATVEVDTPHPVTIVVRDGSGLGIEGIAAANVVLSVSGANNTLTQPSGVTDADGAIAGAGFESSTAAARTVTVTVAGLALTSQPAVNVIATGALDAGSISAAPGDGIVTISENVAPSGGTAPYVRNLYRSETVDVKGSELAAAVTLPYEDETVVNGTPYYYTLEVDDDDAGTDDTAQVSATPVATPTLVFDSPWSTATGTTDNALGDGGVWDAFSGSGRALCLNVVANSGLGFTKTTNVFRMETIEGESGLVIANNAVTQQTDFWGQVYVMNTETNPDNIMLHCGTLLPVGSIQLAWLARWPGATTFRLGVRPAGTPHSRYYVTLSNGVWYRYAWSIVFQSSTQFRFYPEVYSYDDGDPTAPGTLLFDYTDFIYEGIASLADFYNGGGYLSCSDLAGMRDLGLGSEDQSSWTTPAGYLYAASMRLSETGPIGPGA